MPESRRKFTSGFKAKVAVEALQEHLTLSELGQKYEPSHQRQRPVGAPTQP
ncbi:MAG: hypothetical protein AAFO96_23410 [Bacteroidota bacterium]